MAEHAYTKNQRLRNIQFGNRDPDGDRHMTYAANYRDFGSYFRDKDSTKSSPDAKKLGILRRIFGAIFETRQEQIEREVARFVARSGGRITDDIERKIMQHFLRAIGTLLGGLIRRWMTEPNMEGGCACRQVRYQAVTTAYIFLGATLEERDLIRVFGDEYRAYRKRVAMLIPGRKSS
jgi:hypothetical protein